MEEFKPVLTKHDFVRRYQAGEFGNASPTWDSLEEFLASDWLKNEGAKFHLRNREKGGATNYNLSYMEASYQWSTMRDRGGWYVSRMAPTEKTVIQGEIKQAEGGRYGLEVYYSTLALPMREALTKNATLVHGVASACLLRRSLCPNSYDWLDELLRRYPGHVVEFSTYSVPWGTLYPRFNTVFWEVRNY